MKPLNLKYCKQCGGVFETLNPEQVFCSNKCANTFNRSLIKPKKSKGGKNKKVSKTCKHCGETFETLNSKQMFCSRQCANTFNRSLFEPKRVKIRKTCKCCGKEFETLIPEQDFCSRLCSSVYNYENSKSEKVCPICNKKFMGGVTQKYCSKECANEVKYVKKGIDKICPICGKSFKGTGRKKYCSKRCANSVSYHKKKPTVKKDTLCWDCQNACCGCSWSRTFTPVKGWVAEPTVITYKTGDTLHTTDTYKIFECPEFKKG